VILRLFSLFWWRTGSVLFFAAAVGPRHRADGPFFSYAGLTFFAMFFFPQYAVPGPRLCGGCSALAICAYRPRLPFFRLISPFCLKLIFLENTFPLPSLCFERPGGCQLEGLRHGHSAGWISLFHFLFFSLSLRWFSPL